MIILLYDIPASNKAKRIAFYRKLRKIPHSFLTNSAILVEEKYAEEIIEALKDIRGVKGYLVIPSEFREI